MITIELKLFAFNELDEVAAATALSDNIHINVADDWWSSVYDDARMVNLSITAFDIDRGSYCHANFVSDAKRCATLILAHHGASTRTYQLAAEFTAEVQNVTISWVSEKAEDDELFVHAVEEMKDKFLKELSREYLKMLVADYDYLTGEDAVKEAFNNYPYWFTSDGKKANHVKKLADTI